MSSTLGFDDTQHGARFGRLPVAQNLATLFRSEPIAAAESDCVP